MTQQEKLTELLHMQVCDYNCESCEYSVSDEICIRHLEEMVTAHLIANGVRIRPKGWWTENSRVGFSDAIEDDVYWFTYTCSECGGEVMNDYHYCPNCAAKMDGVKNESN